MTHRFFTIGLGTLAVLSLAACNPTTPDTTTGSSSSSSKPTGGISLAAEGEFCGGIAGILCADGLSCEYEGTYPDAGGTCRQ